MDSGVKIYLERAKNELRLARAIFELSGKEEVKTKLGANPDDTFYSSVITHSYYSIFYCARAYLLSKEIKIPEQGQHNAVYYGFKKFVKQGILDEELLKIYEDARIKAEALLGIFEDERGKRSDFTYKTIAQANISPAKESINNCILFLSNLKVVLERRRI